MDEHAIGMLHADQPTLMTHAGSTLPGVVPPPGVRPGVAADARPADAGALLDPAAGRAAPPASPFDGLLLAIRRCLPEPDPGPMSEREQRMHAEHGVTPQRLRALDEEEQRLRERRLGLPRGK